MAADVARCGKISARREQAHVFGVKHLLWWVFSEILFDALRERPYPIRVHLSVLVKLDDLLRRQHKPHYFESRTFLSNFALANRDSLLLKPRQTGVQLV